MPPPPLLLPLKLFDSSMAQSMASLGFNGFNGYNGFNGFTGFNGCVQGLRSRAVAFVSILRAKDAVGSQFANLWGEYYILVLSLHTVLIQRTNPINTGCTCSPEQFCSER
jgi:hypothetical protein